MFSTELIWTNPSILMLGFVCIGAMCVLGKEIQEIISRLDRLINPCMGEWRRFVGEAPGAETADYDDSSWERCAPSFTWEGSHTAWARGRVAIPETVVSIPTKGSLVRFKGGVDQHGELFINGQSRQHFWQNHLSAVLTEEAQPGESFIVAIRGGHGEAKGMFFRPALEIGAVDEAIPDVQNYIQDFRYGEKALQMSDNARSAKLEQALVRSAELLDVDSLEAGKIEKFRKSLSPAVEELELLSQFLKEYTVHLVGHAHIDMNWLWLWPETVEVCQNTFTSMTDIMEEVPEFTFSQSQATTYICVQESKPELFAKMKKYIKDGRWEITGGTWVEGDMNMAAGEAIVRQILYAKKYFRETFGKEIEVCWEPDTFGHAWTVPQIMKKSGLKYYYHFRCGKGDQLFWWQGPDGSRVLVYNDRTYSDVLRAHAAEEVIEFKDRYGVKDALYVYGVGDHGGGPTRNDVQSALSLQKRKVLPKFKFSTFHEYMSAVESQSPDLAVINDELNFEFDGCYTSHSDIKRMNRTSENTLTAAEAFSVMARSRGRRYPTSALREAWQVTCFNQFHDIFDGSGIHGTYDYSRELYEKVETAWTSILSGSMNAVAADIDTSGVEGTPVVVFNQLSWERTELVETALPKGLRGALTATDEQGNTVPTQKVGDKLVFLAKSVPSLGYKVFWIGKAKAGKTTTVKADATTLENEFLKVKIHPKLGTIVSMFDKVSGKELIPKGSAANQLQILMEKPHSMTAWIIGPISRMYNLRNALSVELIADGPNVAAIRTKHKFRKSQFTQEIRLEAGSRQVKIRMTADWYEQGTPKKDAAMLKVAFPVNVNSEKATYELPFGFIQRDSTGQEYPSLKWIDLSDDSGGVSLMNSNKYGHDVKGNQMRLTLLRSSYDPDPQPDQGVHEMSYALHPHGGDWKKAQTLMRAWELNNPLMPLAVERHSGELPTSRSFVTVEPENLVVTGLKKAEDSDDLVLRFYEAWGQPTKARVKVNLPVKSWAESDLVERELPDTGGNIKDGVISVPVGKHEIKTLLLR